MAHVKITSAFTNESWEGEVDLHLRWRTSDPTRLEQIFRLFNRVDEADSERLERMGYTLPSLSVGDRVELDDEVWYVHPIGFKREPCDQLGRTE